MPTARLMITFSRFFSFQKRFQDDSFAGGVGAKTAANFYHSLVLDVIDHMQHFWLVCGFSELLLLQNTQ